MVFLIKLVRSGDRHFYFLVLFIICERLARGFINGILEEEEEKKSVG